MTLYFLSLALVTLNNEVSLVVYKSLYSYANESCDDACSQIGPTYSCNFDQFWSMPETERMKLMSNNESLANPGTFSTQIAEIGSTIQPGYMEGTKQYVGYKNSSGKDNQNMNCSAKPYESGFRRFCPCRRNFPYRTFYVGRLNQSCDGACKCRRQACSTSYMARSTLSERQKILIETATIFQNDRIDSFPALEEFDFVADFVENDVLPLLVEGYVIWGSRDDLSNSTCNAVPPAGNIDRRFCECLYTPSSIYEEPDKQQCENGASVVIAQLLFVYFIALVKTFII